MKKKKDLPKKPTLSRQRLWQLENARNGLCQRCSEPAWRDKAVFCQVCREANNARRRVPRELDGRRRKIVLDTRRKRA